MSDTKIVRQQMSQEVQAGYKCAACNVETIVSAPIGAQPFAPTNCLNCNSTELSLSWGPHIQRSTSVTENP